MGPSAWRLDNTPLSGCAASPRSRFAALRGQGTQPSLRGGPCSAALASGRAGFMQCGPCSAIKN
ncbi:hypothetical protein CBP34_00685 [Acidovorax carolinensis]|uniref:Uncharacterized protein n=1 Tax=Acidovorax carolinensis TaxID=553814 RepID=A0A240TZ73_9BURK|nr:hypothetical protein CBP34_00685 [Acidovorax carolinensis]